MNAELRSLDFPYRNPLWSDFFSWGENVSGFASCVKSSCSSDAGQCHNLSWNKLKNFVKLHGFFFFFKSSTACFKTVCEKDTIKDLSQGFQVREYLWDHSRQGRSPLPNLPVWYVGFVQQRKERKEKKHSLSSKNDCIKNVKTLFKDMLLAYFLQTLFMKVAIVWLGLLENI